MGRFRTKCRFGFSKALLSTTQPPHQIKSENIAGNQAFPICNLIADTDFVACSRFHRSCQLSIGN